MNSFGKEFLKLVKDSKKQPLVFPSGQTISFIDNGQKYSMEVVALSYENFSADILNHCWKIALEKAKKTMDQNQAGKKRTADIKVINQFRGVLAETIVHLYLYNVCNHPFDKIVRYDLVRETFDYDPEEYDIMLTFDSPEKKNLELEIRSSHNPFSNLSRYLSKRGVLCTYTNHYKQKENVKDISLAVVYDIPDYSGKLEDDKRKKFVADLKNNRYKIYLVTHCATKKVFLEKGEITNLGQGDTKYIQVPFSAISPSKYHIKNIVA